MMKNKVVNPNKKPKLTKEQRETNKRIEMCQKDIEKALIKYECAIMAVLATTPSSIQAIAKIVDGVPAREQKQNEQKA